MAVNFCNALSVLDYSVSKEHEGCRDVPESESDYQTKSWQQESSTEQF